jgi:glycosyltransferase involved in cell wall biosynthesis
VKSIRRRGGRSRRRVLIIVQNLPVPFDRRVWLEACALRDAGFKVSVVCPKAPGDPSFQELEGIRIRKYDPPPAASGALSYAWEFAYCWVRTLVLVVRAAAREGFDVIQACNPPDTYWALAAPFKPFGKRFVFDQHDLCPEVYVSRFPNGSRIARRALLFLERATYALADHVVATNESYRETAVGRGNVRADHVTVVRTGPNPERLRKGTPVASWRHGKRYLCAYLGVMGPQDGVDLALRAAATIVRWGRDDMHCVFMGRPARNRRPSDVYWADSRRDGFRGALDGRRWAFTRPAQPTQRRLDDEQDDGVHGVRAPGRRLRSQGDAGLSRAGRGVRATE